MHILRDLAQAQGVSLYATWHSRMAHAVAAAKAWLADRVIHDGRIIWREDVRQWHPGQDWIFEAGGMGVFDPGINALSILTEILPMPVHLRAAELDFPLNRQAPSRRGWRCRAISRPISISASRGRRPGTWSS